MQWSVLRVQSCCFACLTNFMELHTGIKELLILLHSLLAPLLNTLSKCYCFCCFVGWRNPYFLFKWKSSNRLDAFLIVSIYRVKTFLASIGFNWICNRLFIWFVRYDDLSIPIVIPLFQLFNSIFPQRLNSNPFPDFWVRWLSPGRSIWLNPCFRFGP